MAKHSWTKLEDIIVCKHYLKHHSDSISKLPLVMDELSKIGSTVTKNSARMKILNYAFLDSGKGLSHPSSQSVEVFFEMHKKSASKKGLSKAAKGIQLGDVANISIRNILTMLSALYGGISSSDLDEANEFFNYKCPYTGRDLRESIKNHENDIVMDHIVPQNRQECGLNVKGNLVWVDRNANSKKGSQSFEEFIMKDTAVISASPSERKDRIDKIKTYQKRCSYNPTVVKEKLSSVLNDYYAEVQKRQIAEVEKIRKILDV